MRPIALLLLAGCLPFPKGPKVAFPDGPIPVDHADDAADSVRASVEDIAVDFVAKHELPGLGVALVHDGSVCYSGGFGYADVAAERPLTHRTPVLLSSVSKTFIGVTAMQGVEAGRFQLDDKVSSLVPFEVDNPKVDGDGITLRDLLTHNSGIEDTGEYDANYAEGDPEIALGDFVEGYLTPGGDYWRPGNFSGRKPGEDFSYSNVGAALAGFAIGRADGQEFMDLVARDVFEPLQMDDSAYLLADLDTKPAVPYDHTGGRDLRAWPQYGYPTYPDGMIRSSARDMGRYLAAMGGDGSLDGVTVLPEARLTEMLTIDKKAGSDEDGQAVAWAMRKLDKRPLYGHNGGDYGSFTEMWVDPETGTGFVLLMNGFPETWSAIMKLERELFAVAESSCL